MRIFNMGFQFFVSMDQKFKGSKRNNFSNLQNFNLRAPWQDGWNRSHRRAIGSTSPTDHHASRGNGHTGSHQGRDK